jgi:hypothetical protein
MKTFEIIGIVTDAHIMSEYLFPESLSPRGRKFTIEANTEIEAIYKAWDLPESKNLTFIPILIGEYAP